MSFAGEEGKVIQAGNYSDDQTRAEKEYFNNPINNSQLYQAGSQYHQNILSNSPNATAEFNAPYMQQFQQQVLPGIAERFAGGGTGAGALNSSAFNQTLATAGSGLQSTLAQLRQQLMQQSAQQGLGYAQQPYSNLQAGLQFRGHENIYQQPTQGWGQSVLKGAAGAAAGYALSGGNPLGALKGVAGALPGA